MFALINFKKFGWLDLVGFFPLYIYTLCGGTLRGYRGFKLQ